MSASYFHLTSRFWQRRDLPRDQQQSDVRSWMDDISNEKGGASLKFESPLDDVSSTDVRWARRLIMRIIELLYYENRWERLVDVALRFNALTE